MYRQAFSTTHHHYQGISNTSLGPMLVRALFRRCSQVSTGWVSHQDIHTSCLEDAFSVNPVDDPHQVAFHAFVVHIFCTIRFALLLLFYIRFYSTLHRLCICYLFLIYPSRYISQRCSPPPFSFHFAVAFLIVAFTRSNFAFLSLPSLIVANGSSVAIAAASLDLASTAAVLPLLDPPMAPFYPRPFESNSPPTPSSSAPGRARSHFECRMPRTRG